MRLVYLSQSIIPSRSANSVQVMKMCDALAGSGHDVTLLVPDRSEVEVDVEDVFSFYGVAPFFGLRRLIYPNIRGQTSIAALHAAWLIRRYRPNLLYTRALGLCLRVSRFVGIPIVLEMHTPVGDTRYAEFKRLVRVPSFRLIVISRALRDWFLQTFPELRGRVVLAPDAADPPPPDLRPKSLRRGNRLLAGYCGQLFNGKGIEVVINLARSMPEIDFHVVGGQDGDLARWRNYAGTLENLVFHGFLPSPEARRHIAAFDVALAPYQHRVSAYGGDSDIAKWMSPLKIFEYMALGKAIVSSNLPVLREVLSHEDNALLCPPDNLAAWQSAIRRLIDPTVRKLLGERAYADFQAKYSWAQRTRRIMAAIADR